MEAINDIGQMPITIHTGRGGRFNNAGHSDVWGVGENISVILGHLSERLFLRYENLHHFENRYGFEKIQELAGLAAYGDEDAADQLEPLFDITVAMLGNVIYTDQTGNPVGLTADEVEQGFGVINFDNEYDSYAVAKACDIDEQIARKVIAYAGYKPAGMDEYLREKHNIQEGEA